MLLEFDNMCLCFDLEQAGESMMNMFVFQWQQNNFQLKAVV